MKERAKLALEWSLSSAQLLLGLIFLARFGMRWNPFAYDDDPNFTRLTTVAIGLFGLAFIVSAITAFARRNRAGWILLALMPMVVFCFAYPETGYLEWDQRGGWFVRPLFSIVGGLEILFYAPLIVLWAVRRRRFYLFCFAIAAAALVFANSRWAPSLLPQLAGWSAPFLLLALFWIVAAKRKWPPLFVNPPVFTRRRIVALAAVMICLDVAMTFALSAALSGINGLECNGAPLITQPVSEYSGRESKIFPTHSVFRAHVLFSRLSLDAYMRRNGDLFRARTTTPGNGHLGLWAIASIQEEFGGVPRWMPRIVLLTGSAYWEGEDYFVDGVRPYGLVDRILPIITAAPCGRTKSAVEAIVDLRVLREAPARTGRRIVGFVEAPHPYVSYLDAPPRNQYIAGMKIHVIGPSGETLVTTDRDGIYQIDDLIPGLYTIAPDLPDTRITSDIGAPWSPAHGVQIKVGAHALIERNFRVFWNGSIAGRVIDQSGKPVNSVFVKLLRADTNDRTRELAGFPLTTQDGTWEVRTVPPGRYIALLCPDGPFDDWPFDLQYYPSTTERKNAAVLELGPGQRLTGIDFTARRLMPKPVELHLTWPDGRPVVDATVCFAYENTEDWEPLDGRECFTRHSDGRGIVTQNFYGNSRVKFYAEQFYYAEKGEPEMYYSPRVEDQVPNLPAKIALVLRRPTK